MLSRLVTFLKTSCNIKVQQELKAAESSTRYRTSQRMDSSELCRTASRISTEIRNGPVEDREFLYVVCSVLLQTFLVFQL